MGLCDTVIYLHQGIMAYPERKHLFSSSIIISLGVCKHWFDVIIACLLFTAHPTACR